MSYKMNYTGVDESGSFEPLPEGTYVVSIERVEETVTKSSGLPMVKVRYKVLNDGKHRNRIVFDQIVLFGKDDKGAGMTKHFLHVIGEPYDAIFEVNPQNWIGKELLVQLKIDKEYNSNKVVSRDEADQIPF